MTMIPQPDPRLIVAAYRYFAFLDQERRTLVYELLPDHMPHDPVFFPADSAVGTLTDTSPNRAGGGSAGRAGQPGHWRGRATRR